MAAMIILFFVASRFSAGIMHSDKIDLAAVFAATASNSIVTSPLSGAVVGQSVHFMATGTSSFPIIAWAVYDDYSHSYALLGKWNGTSLDKYITMSAGARTGVVVQFWDSAGRVYKNPIFFTVASAVVPFSPQLNSQSLPITTDHKVDVVSVSVTSPVACSDSCSVKFTSPIKINASAFSSDSTITGWHIYVDSVNSYSANNVSKINSTISLSPGTHTVLVRAWDAQGVYGTTRLKLTVASITPNPNSVLISDIDDASPWQTCGNCGNSGATGPTASYSMTQHINDPAIAESFTQFNISGNSAYSNAYWYIKHQAPTKLIKKLTYDFWLYVPVKFASAPQAIEFEMEQHVDGLIYNYAWQADYGSKMWRVFNYTAKKWESSGIVFIPFSPNTWHHIVAEFHADGTVGYHDALSIDGDRNATSISHVATSKKVTPQFTNAFQLDLNGKKIPYSVYVDKMNINYSL